MNKLAKKIITSKFIIILMMSLCLSQVAEAAQPASDELLESFLAVNQTTASNYFSDNIKNHQAILDCLQSAQKCSDASIQTELNDQDTNISFNQKNLVEFMQARHNEYRYIVGLAYYKVLRSHINRGRVSITPMKATGAVIFDIRSEAGKKEWAAIAELYEKEEVAMVDYNQWLTQKHIDGLKVSSKENLSFMKSQIAVYIQKYPFLTKMMKRDNSKADYIKSVKKMIKTYESAFDHVNSLEGDDRFELLGFVQVFQAALESFSEQAQAELIEHFQYLQETDTFWKRVKDIVFNGFTLFMVACYTSAIFAPPMLFVCGAIGLRYAIPGVYDLAVNSKRMIDYMQTGAYDEGVFSKYMMSNLISGIMYTIYLRAAIPGFVKNGIKIKTTSVELVKKIRLRGKRILTLDKKVFIEEAKLIWDYTKYYSKELGLETGSEQLASLAGKTNSIIPAMAAAFSATMKKVKVSNPSIVKYSDMLSLTRQAVTF